MIQKLVHFQEIDILLIETLVLGRFQLHVNQVKILVLGIVIVIENSIPNQFYDVQDTLIFITNEKTQDLVIFFLKIFAIVLFPDITPKIDSPLGLIFLHIGLHQHHVPGLRVHVENLSMLFFQTPLKFMTTIIESFQSQQTNVKLTWKPLKWEMV